MSTLQRGDGIRPAPPLVPLFLAIALTVGLPPSANAADPVAKIPYEARTALNYPTGARSLGMGSTGTAYLGQHTTGFYNPASLAWVDGIMVEAGKQAWYRDYNTFNTHIAGGLHLGDTEESNWRAGASVGYSTLSFRTSLQQPGFLPGGTSTDLKSDDYYLSASAAIGWQDRLFSVSFGGAGKYLRDEIIDETATAWALDLGVTAALTYVTDSNVTLRARTGGAVLDLSTSLSSSSLEGDVVGAYRVAIGGDIHTPTVKVFDHPVPLFALALDYDRIYPTNLRDDPLGNRPDSDGWAIGTELSLAGFLQGRYGQGRNINIAAGRGHSTTFGMGVGWAVHRWRAQFDFAYVSTTPESIFVPDWDEAGFTAALGATF